MIEKIQHNGVLIALIIGKEYRKEGIEFLTPNDFSLQLGHMTRPVGYRVIPHVHNPVERRTIGTQEVLFIKSGKVRIDFYSFDQKYIDSRELAAGDIILLAGSGHSLEVLEEATIVEIKNGPFIKGFDKDHFEGRKR
jgi:hypothetical protein